MNPVTGQQPNNLAVGEVVRASTTEFTSQCHRLYEAPPLGSLVRCGSDNTVYAIVGEVATQSLDPGRHTIAMGEDEETEAAVYERNPQLTRLLTTEFRCIVVGHRADGILRRYLAPLPPRIHAFVHQCSADEVLELSDSLDFMSLLLAAPVGSQDDMITAFLRQASLCHPEPRAFLVNAGRELATLLGGQVQRLNGILRRLSP
jgi:hypothetical protein